MRNTGHRTTRSGTMAHRAYARPRDQRIGYTRLMLVSVATAGVIGLGVGVACVDRPLAGRHCSVPNVTTHHIAGLTLSCSPASTRIGEAVWQYVPSS